ncbi:hypothetical protein PACTADRAFT_4233 [Pachysolen tannophilus NRRL Y-2460]|uniref:Serine/threonine-protein kinase TOR n=1 Tax=Pachysolen tannophilus NRRL Y-2460 TaxID=669874 RepID=A0A1E4TRI9_PACTA|nr:hypothetical protein PACTADRAFT_4233 [Pachysolen tannophilus NRRL Y-2460]
MSQLQVQQQQNQQQLLADNYVIEQIFNGLKSKNNSIRLKAARELKNHIISISRDFTSSEQISRYNNDINKRIFELINSNLSNDKMGGIAAINALLELNNDDEFISQTNNASSLEENTNKITRFANYLRVLIPSTDLEVMKYAAVTLGKLAMPGGTLTAEFVEFEIKRSIEWLVNDKQDLKKHAAVLIISSLAYNSPTLIYGYINDILGNIWITLKDPKQNIREDTAIAMRNCIDLIFDRDAQLKKYWFNKLYNEASAVFKVTAQVNSSSSSTSATVEEIHGSLLCYRELVSRNTSLLNDKIDDIYDSIMKLKDYKTVIIRNEVAVIIPKLAKFNSGKFIDKYLHRVLLYYLSQLKLNKDRNFIFISIGDIAIEVEGHITTYLDGILNNIRESLSIKNLKAKREIEPACFYCLSKLSIAIGSSLTKYLQSHHILKLLFKCSISDNFINLLKSLIENLPSLEPLINDKLINTVSFCLSGYEFQQPGSPESRRQMNALLAMRYRQSMIVKDGTISSLSYNGSAASLADDLNSSATDDADVAVIIQAFKILSTFNFKDYSLTELVRSCTIKYIDNDSPEVRLRAALTSANIFMRDKICFQTSENSLRTVSEVLDKLLTIAITDSISDIRLEVLKSLGENFDPQLSQADNVRLLFIALNDENFEIRKVAITIIGRLSSINPAYIVPSLRKTLIQLLTNLEYGGHNIRKREESAILLSLLVSHSKEMTRPYVKPILDVLLPQAKDQSSSVSSSAITAMGELSVVGGEDLKPFIGDLMPIILETFQDQSSSFKRDAALKTLGQLASSSGYVIQPLLDYPQLLGMLVNILKSETSPIIRRETVRLLGILGALDPYKHREVERNNKDVNLTQVVEQNAPSIDVALLMQGMSPSNEEYYPTVVVHTLMKMLKDTSLGAHHTAVIQAIMYIFQTLGLRCVSFLNQIIPGIINVMHTCSPSMLEFYFQQMGVLISIVKQHIRPFLDDIFQVIKEFFHLPNLQVTVLGLIESISRALESEFKLYLSDILTLLLDIFDNDKSVYRNASLRVLKTFVVFGNNIDLYVHLIVPQIVKMFEFAPNNLRKAAIETVGKISRNVSLNDMASRIIHPLLRVLSSNNSDELRKVSMNTICLLLLQMGTDFMVFIPVINKVLLKHKLSSAVYDQLVNKLLNGEPLPQNLIIDKEFESQALESMDIEPSAKKLPVNQQVLKNVWDASQKRTREDWQEWLRRLSVEFLKESPSHALRACSSLAGVYYPLAKDLFNASFASCWNELYSQHQEELIQSLCIALSSPNNTPEIHQTLLNLAEFMEHDDKPLPIRIPTLGQYAQRCHAYAKALHYKELEFMQEPTTPTIETLISINNQLQQEDAAIGILKHAQQHHDLQLKETWFEKLGRWDDALQAYSEREKEDPDSMEITMGKMRCLHALGEWEQLSELAQEKWLSSSSDVKRTIAPLAAAASWGLYQWDRMDKYINVMKAESPDKAFFNAILSLHRNHFEEASNHILKARDLLVTEITALVSESYNRAYSVIVRVQMLAELEEIIKYKCYPQGSEKRAIMRKTWNTRLLGCQRNVDIWQRMLKVRALVVKPKQDMDMWIKFANLCRKSGRLGLAEKSLSSLLDEGSPENPRPSKASPQVVYAQLKYMWSTGQQREALSHLVDFTSKLSRDLGLNENEAIAQPLPSEVPGAPKHVEEYTKLLARCYLKQGEWKVVLTNNWRKDEAEGILGSYLLATHFDGKWYKAWHNWALANFEVISLHSSEISTNSINGDFEDAMSSANVDRGLDVQPGLIQHYVVPAIKGFFHSISLSEANSLQDTLRLLTLWFKFGGIQDAAQAILEGFGMVKIDTWLEVIPQLISRIHQPNQIVSTSLLGLLTDLGKAHPQALVYPLSVAIKSDSISRQRAASTIIDKMRIHSATLVEQSELVSHELIRVAVLWHELWYEGLEDASRLYFGEHNTEKMFTVLEPLHKLLEKGPETLREVSFQNAFGRDLNDAREWVLNYRRTKDVANLNQAWDIYYNVFRRISRQLPQLQSLDLHYVSPKLLAAKDLELAVPGTYEAGKPIIRIICFDPTFTVISSKQRPRKLNCKGSDGKNYQYALKGHEDIRQDSLVMQLFGLVNTLLLNDGECFKRHLDIQQFPAIPLSPKSGLLGWVPNSDTFHVLIREYRESRKILLNIEHRIMLQMAPDYDNLTLLQKVEVFTYALDNTRGQDLYKVLWLKSRSSEAWLDRRTTYTRSLAVMSMVGYILGLGDRHPSNLLMDRITGKVVHIDFGDCFEAAILREKYPEKVPFRLTRMLSYAMEVSGIEGSFRITCEQVMRVLRDNKESLMAILEAFAYDPLINWGFDFPINQVAEATGYTFTSVNPAELLRTGKITEQEAAKLELQYKAEIRNARAALVLRRITDKLTGNDFKRCHELDVPQQVDRLIQQATSVENLCQHYIGWCSFW